jgi:glycosyltransferase involved in cell wall biosynthesis
MIRVAVLSEGEGSASEVYRVRWLLAALRREGIDATLFPSRPGKYEAMDPAGVYRRLWKLGTAVFHLRRVARRLFDLPKVRDFDAVLLQRDLVTYPFAALEWLLFRFNRRVVFDYDDAIYFTPRVDGTWRRSARRRRKIEKILRWSRGVAAGSAALEEFARAVQPRVARVPTVVDTARYRPRAPAGASADVVIGWFGIPSNQIYLAPLVPALRRVLERFPRARVRILTRHYRPLDLPRVEFVEWTRDAEPEQVAAFDIGLSPMADNEWTRAKCGARVLVYMACGVPCVASPVGTHRELIEDGRTGLLAETPEQWESALARLIERPPERRSIAAAARAFVESHFTPAQAAPKLAALLREVAR